MVLIYGVCWNGLNSDWTKSISPLNQLPKVPLRMLSIPMKVHKLKDTEVTRKQWVCSIQFDFFLGLNHVALARRMPFVPPDELVPWLLKNAILPNNSHMDEQIEEYWRYLASKGVPHTYDKPGSGCIPLWLWGDDCRFNEQGHKIVIIAMGAVLDERKSSKDTVYPLLCYQVETYLKLVYLLLKNTSPLAHPIPLPQSSQGAKFGFQNFASLLETGPMAAYSGFVQWTCQPQRHLEKPGCNIHDFLFR